MGIIDRTIRLVVAAIIVALYYFDVLSGTLGIVFLVIAGILILTSLIRLWPLYLSFGIKTCSQ